MWRAFGRGALAGLLVMAMADLAVAQDEDLRMGDDPAYYQRVEVPEAGIAISFPSGWGVDVELEYDQNVPGDPQTGFWRVLFADGGDEGWCDLTRNLHPVGELADLASVTADGFLEHFGGDATAQTTPVPLAAGDAWRLDVQVPEGPDFITGYMVNAPPGHLDEPSRFTLACQSDERDARDWLDVADSLEWLDGGAEEEPDRAELATALPGVPDGAAAWSELSDITTHLPVSEVALGPAFMTARCDSVLWIEYPDGSFEERLECLLTDEPVDSPEEQGGLPQERLPISGGECEWVSDFWAETDGSEVWATAWEVIVEYDGHATARSWYAPEELNCPG